MLVVLFAPTKHIQVVSIDYDLGRIFVIYEGLNGTFDDLTIIHVHHDYGNSHLDVQETINYAFIEDMHHWYVKCMLH